jgi:hypothetical protein
VISVSLHYKNPVWHVSLVSILACSHHDIAEKNAHKVLNNNHSLKSQ